MSEGHEIVFEREGDQSVDQTAGDLVFVVRGRSHPEFARIGANLYAKVLLNLTEALLGFQKEIRHLDGHLVTLHRARPTQPGFVLELEDEGMPVHQYPSEKGKLFVEFEVRLLDAVDYELAEGLRKLFNVPVLSASKAESARVDL